MTENASNHAILHIAGRKRELKRVADLVENVKAGVANCFFSNFFAPHGFGKTAFLESIWEKYEWVLPTSLVRVTGLPWENQALALSNMLIQLIGDIEFRLPKRITRLPSDYEQSTDKAWLAELVIDLVERAARYEKLTLLLLDDYDAMPNDIRRWFETKVVGQISRTKKIAVIMTSEFELRFTERLDLRMRLESFELSGLTIEAISSSFPQYEGIASEIRRITGGMPVLTRELIQQLENSSVTTDADFWSREQELVKKYYRSHVNETVFQAVNQDIQETMLVLAILRRFDVKVLRGVLPKVLPDHYDGYGTADYLDLIERLGSQVRWRIQGGYALNQALRMVLQGYVLFEKPGLYEQVNRAAIILYRGLIEKEYREDYLVELLYHELALLRVGKESKGSEIQAQIGDELLKHLNSDRIAVLQETDLDSLRNTLRQDPDLKDFVSEDVLLAIQSMINERIKESRVISFSAERRIA